MRDERNAKYLDAFNAFVKALIPEGDQKFTTDSEEKIFEVLTALQGKSRTKELAVNFHFWDHGWHKFRAYSLAPDPRPRVVNMHWGLGAPFEVGRPLEEFAAYHFEDDPDFNFMRFSYRGLPQVGINNLDYSWVRKHHREEFVRLADGTVIERGMWDAGYKGHGPDGEEIPFEEGDTVAIRELMPGGFFICSIGSYLNDTRFEPYMRHILNHGEESDAYKGIFECLEKEKKRPKDPKNSE